jgi:hypothetical protein
VLKRAYEDVASVFLSRARVPEDSEVVRFRSSRGEDDEASISAGRSRDPPPRFV